MKMRRFHYDNYIKLMRILQEKTEAGDPEAKKDLELLVGYMEKIVGHFIDVCNEKIRDTVRNDHSADKTNEKLVFTTMDIHKIARKYGVDEIYIGRSANKKDVDAFCFQVALMLYAEGL